jgi:hypothetical protein
VEHPLGLLLEPEELDFWPLQLRRLTEQAPGAFGLEAGGPNFGNYAGDSSALNQSLAAGWTYTISPTLVNEFRLGYMRYHVSDVPNGYGTDPAAAAGIPGLNLDKTYTSGMPYFDIQDNRRRRRQTGIWFGRQSMQLPADAERAADSVRR